MRPLPDVLKCGPVNRKPLPHQSGVVTGQPHAQPGVLEQGKQVAGQRVVAEAGQKSRQIAGGRRVVVIRCRDQTQITPSFQIEAIGAVLDQAGFEFG